MRLLRFSAVALFTSISVVPLASRAVATPLDKDTCANLQTERKKLLTPQMQAALEQGPDWVKKHLNDQDIEAVRQFLAVEEKIEFRCRGGGVAKPSEKAAARDDDDDDKPPLPDRKPVPPGAVAGGEATPMPDRKPGTKVEATADAKPSQAVADSDKTAPSKAKATR
jgi:hypothetical protein